MKHEAYCYDCTLMRTTYDVACIEHTPEAERPDREVKVQRLLTEALQKLPEVDVR